jgi:hypothetical protein
MSYIECRPYTSITAHAVLSTAVTLKHTSDAVHGSDHMLMLCFMTQQCSVVLCQCKCDASVMRYVQASDAAACSCTTVMLCMYSSGEPL